MEARGNSPKTSLLNYQVAVKYFPTDPQGWEPFEITDEFILALDERENIERLLRAGNRYLKQRLEQIRATDRALLARRKALLHLAPWYATLRKGRHYPRSHWWWYLDRLDAQCAACGQAMTLELVAPSLTHNGMAIAASSVPVYLCPRGHRPSTTLAKRAVQELIEEALKTGD